MSEFWSFYLSIRNPLLALNLRTMRSNQFLFPIQSLNIHFLISSFSCFKKRSAIPQTKGKTGRYFSLQDWHRYKVHGIFTTLNVFGCCRLLSTKTKYEAVLVVTYYVNEYLGTRICNREPYSEFSFIKRYIYQRFINSVQEFIGLPFNHYSHRRNFLEDTPRTVGWKVI